MIWIYITVALLIGWITYRWQFWRPVKRGLVACMYHHIGYLPKSDWQYAFTITPERFKEQLDVLHKHGFTPILPRDILAAKKAGSPLPAKPIILTFDDGTLDTFHALFPILQERRVKALVFLITDFIGTQPDYMTWDQARQMQQSGLVEFGSHTCSHARLRKISDEEIKRELSQSKQIIEEKLAVPCSSFCYPFGSGGFDQRVRPLVFQAGYQFDFSTKQGINPWPWTGKKTILRTFPRGGETLTDFYIQITRGKSKF